MFKKGVTTIRKPYRPTPPKDDGPRTNESITAQQIRLIDVDGEMHGVVSLQTGLDAADEAGLDLVEISPNADPPVCKVMDYSKYKYEQQKRASEARKKQKTVDVKEIKIRPGIESHDYAVKMRNAQRFLKDGNKVKVTMRFRGREMAHQHLGIDVLNRLKEDVSEFGKVELEPKLEGRQIIMVIGPDKV